MLRKTYLVLAIVFAGFGMVSTVAGFAYTMYQLTVIGKTLDQSMEHGTILGFAISFVSFAGWILFSYLFVREDERLESDTDS